MGLLVIGDVVTDVVALHEAPVATGTDTAADIVLRPGGSGANTASWAAHLGADARLLTRVGFDTGEWHQTELLRDGVRPHMRMDPDHPTAVVIAMVDSAGERSMLTNRGAGGLIGLDDWADDLLDDVAHLHLSGYTLFAEPGLRLARTAMAEAAGRGVTISVDPSSVGFLHEFGPGRFLHETASAKLIIPNLDEALLLTGEITAERAAVALSETYGTAAVKRGPDGALLARDGRVTATAPGVAAEVVDSTGAGDAFAAGFLTALLGGAGDEEALASGCRAGADAVSLVGGRPRIRRSPSLGSNQLYPLDTD
ncbi:Sugar or nucleoside kinase, ribokinase family [Sinosporangium album]|uniref:Sugar or nucleoside kinase, ribokinase family n=1 Tax=Sinosporangium album TaxID=504805 RepID=A0A1G7R3Z0_9ACTN|nr:sugar kinase [Sinosporangium album]SDG05424.1 Sugar or nucleoside kinase, ribokinase family [Sinosporangium album]